MRIIAGEFRGRRLLGPESDATRPITDRAKQSLFDVLAPLLPNAVVYDCFAGTGSMGLESLSRGARHAVFFEKDHSALQRLRENIQTLGVKDRSTLVSGDLFRAFGPTAMERAGKADLFFFDPPYRFVNEKADQLKQLMAVVHAHHLNPEATLIFRHDPGDELELAGFRRYDQREYGRMRIDLLRPES